MKAPKPIPVAVLLVVLFLNTINVHAQIDTSQVKSSKIYVVIKNDGSEYVGTILSQDAREVLIETKNLGQIVIPKHEIREIREVRSGEMSQKGEYLTEEVFATRYFITTNGIPISKGESYIQWNLYGPDFQFGVAKNFGVGIMSTWVGMPIIGSAKYSIKLAEKANVGLGILLGTGSWAQPEFGLALPFGALTFGDRRNNINLSAGYGTVWSGGSGDGRVLFSIAGMKKMGNKASLIFDSFIMPGLNGNYDGWALLIPGIRFQTGIDKAFQFGFAGIIANSKMVPAPIPMVQWYRKL